MTLPTTPSDFEPFRPTRAVAVRSAFWAALGAILRYTLAGLTMLALTWLLEPGDFGLVAITFLAMQLIAHIATVGFHDALIQRPHLDATDLNTAFWSALTVSGSFTVLVIVLAPLIAHIYNQPRLAPLLVGMSLIALIQAASVVPGALLNRRMDFRTVTVIRTVGMITGGLCAITVAVLGGGPWSRAAQFAAINLTALLLIWRAIQWRPRWQLSRTALRQLWTFAPSVSVFTLLVYIISNADDLLIGYRLGTDVLGYYTLAYSFMAWPIRDVLGSGSVVLYPIFARFQDDLPRLQQTYLESIQLATIFAFPTLALLAITAPVFIPWLLGARWEPSVLTLQILAISGLRESTMALNGLVYRALGKPQLHAVLGFCTACCYVIGFLVGLDYGIEGVAFFYGITGVMLQPVLWWVILSTIKLSMWRWLGALVPPAIATGLMSAAAMWTLHLTRAHYNISNGLALAVTGIIAATIYGVSLVILAPVALRRTVTVTLEVVRGRLVGTVR